MSGKSDDTKQSVEEVVLRMRGAPEPIPARSAIHVDEQQNLVSIKVKAEFRPGAARAIASQETLALGRNDLVEIEFEDNITVWMTAEEYRARFGSGTVRDGSTDTATPVPEMLDVLPKGLQARGPIGWVVKSLKVIGVDLHGLAAAKIARKVEDKVKGESRPGPGFYRCRLETGAFGLEKPAGRVKFEGDRILLFLHGTASSTWGSFGDLWSEARRGELNQIRNHYQGNVYAFEHRTLTESPIENARDLVNFLAGFPKGVTIDLVSHSRGGLVGELLCRVTTTARENGNPKQINSAFDEQDFALFGDAPEHAENRAALQALAIGLEKAEFRIGRFVRVACPALGTTLASRKLDRWLSVVGSVAKAAGLHTPVGEAFKDIGEFVAAVVQERTDPQSLPGLEAMMPDSPVVRLVNWRGVRVAGELTVIAGDIEPDAWWARLLIWASDRFYEGDHDLVVNTQSMYGGAGREEGKALLSPHKGPNVNHFTYFGNRDSAGNLVRVLTRRPEAGAGLVRLFEPTVDIARALARSATAGPRPVVFVLPGIMGSELEVKGNRVWVDLLGLTLGEFTKLRIDARGVNPTNAYARFYGELIEFLGESHKVVEFPFDWRLPIEQEADRLALRVQTELHAAQADNQPVRILAHSMGGLVARAMIARHTELWAEMCRHNGARLVMLGTPNGGSHSITELLVARSKTLGMLALLDLGHSEQELLEVVSRFPGALAMLPKDAREDYFSADVWRRYHQQDGKGWVLPADADLAAARAFRTLMDGAAIDPARMCYVAGSADKTLAEMEYDAAAGKIRFNATTRGDGRVTWESGIPAGVPAWYLDVEHGDLSAHPPAFPAFLDLLESGHTSRLPQTAPIARAAEALFPSGERELDLYPDERTLGAAIMGAGTRKHRKSARAEPLVKLRVVQGDLTYARYPVAVGHYVGDPIMSAESALNNAVDGELKRRHMLGIYPGLLETCAIFPNPRLRTQSTAEPAAAIVMGLGQAGELTGAGLSSTFTRALLEYALGYANTISVQRQEDAAMLGICALLVGSAAGGISVTESVNALVKGLLQANTVLSEKNQPQRFTRFEIIEIYEDQAILAVRALRRLSQDSSVSGKLDLSEAETLKSERGGRRRITFDDPPGWWDRIQILADGTNRRTTALRFLTLTRRARNELRTVATQTALVDAMIDSSIRSSRYDANLARALYERLVPNEVKDQVSQRDNLMLMLDETSARFPWELMDDAFASSARPLAVEHGVLRQLATSIMRERPVLVGDARALVVGDPVSDFPELPGAQAEAREVCSGLESSGFEVHKCLRSSAGEVVQQLYARVYKVLHLAGHGVYNYLPEAETRCDECGQGLTGSKIEEREQSAAAVTGMVLGDGLFLTPAEVRQMRQVPELVFINCCHLGRIEEGRSPVRFNLLAANLATEFIRMGVRAVVAAGWAVDDGAAKIFAGRFYHSLLEGDSFGVAVREARKAAYQARPGTNTWGAYQCYGDPDFTLVTGLTTGRRVAKPLHFASRNELVNAIENIEATLKDKGGRDVSGEIEWLARYEQYAQDKSWNGAGDGRIGLALARAYSEAEAFDKAVGHFDNAQRNAAASMTLRDQEQLPNLRARAAMACWREGKAAAGQIDHSITEIRELLRASETTERFALLGSAWRRRAWISRSPAAFLGNMQDAYAKAYELSQQDSDAAVYPLLNIVVAGLIMQWYPATEDKAPKMRELRRHLKTARGLLPKEEGVSQERADTWDPWLTSMAIDCQLLEALLEGECDAQRATFVNKYREFSRRASPREFASVLDNMEFLYTLAAGAETKESLVVAACIRLLMRELNEKN